MAHQVGSPACPADLEMVASFAGRPLDSERERDLVRGGRILADRREPADGSSHESA
jgi:hypothetical protein